MSSEAAGVIITLIGASALVLAILGSLLGRRRTTKPVPQGPQEQAPTVQVESVAPAAHLPPPPPSKTSGLHFVPAAASTLAPPAPRRLGGNYVRRSPPKRSTATRQKQDDATG